MFSKAAFISLLLISTTLHSAEPIHIPLFRHIDAVAAPIQVSDWLVGRPLSKVRKNGHIYVLEFWSTGCGPCVQAIPTLNRLQEKYKGSVTIIGISSANREYGLSKNAKLNNLQMFLQKRRGEIKYRMAFDAKNVMYQKYMDAFQQSGIPTAFVVDQEGRVVFVGHAELLDPILNQVINKTWNDSLEKEEFRKRWTKDTNDWLVFKVVKEVVKPLIERKKYKEALAILDHYDDVSLLFDTKFLALLAANQVKKAEDFAKKTFMLERDNLNLLLMMISSFNVANQNQRKELSNLMYGVAAHLKKILDQEDIPNATRKYFFPVIAEAFYHSGHPRLAKKAYGTFLASAEVERCMAALGKLK